MITKRDITIALFTCLLTAGVAVLAQPPAKPVLGSSAFEWNSLEVKTNQAGGLVRKFFDSPTATLENLECHCTTIQPGKSPHAPHHHPDEELMIIREGTVEVLVNGEWKRIGPGSVFFAASNVEHGLRNVGDVPAVYHVIRWISATTPKSDTKK